MHARSISTALPATVSMASLALLVGCSNTPPIGNSGGRVPAGTTTQAESNDPRLLPDDFLEFSDAASSELARDLPRIQAMTNAQGRATVIYGQIDNKTGNISSGDFEVTRDRIKENLVESSLLSSAFRFLIDRRALEQLQAIETNEPPAQGTRTPRFDPNHAYFLNGTMFRINRSNTNFYRLNVELVAYATGETVWTESYESKRWTP